MFAQNIIHIFHFCLQVSHIKLVAGRVIVARLDGQLDFLELVCHSNDNYLLLCCFTDPCRLWSQSS